VSGKLQQLQHSYLNTLYSQKVPAAAYRVKHIKRRGHVLSSDPCVVLPQGALPRSVCKHAISAVLPAHVRNPGNAHASA
jgi:sRNA-binding regulator protein Hfq